MNIELTDEQIRALADLDTPRRESPREQWLRLLAQTVNSLLASGITTATAATVHQALSIIAPGDSRIRTACQVGLDLAGRGFELPKLRTKNERLFRLRQLTEADVRGAAEGKAVSELLWPGSSEQDRKPNVGGQQ